MNPLTYLILVSFNHIGDYNQALSLKDALKQEKKPIEVELFDV